MRDATCRDRFRPRARVRGLVSIEHAHLICGARARRRAIAQTAGRRPCARVPLKRALIFAIDDMPVDVVGIGAGVGERYDFACAGLMARDTEGEGARRQRS